MVATYFDLGGPMRTKPLLACALAAVFALSGCGQSTTAEPAEEPSASSAAAETPAATATTEAPNYRSNGAVAAHISPATVEEWAGTGDKQATLRYIAEFYAYEVTRNRYALSGQLVEDGQRPVDVAAVFAKFYSEELQTMLKEAESFEELEGKIKFPIMALGTSSENGEPIASKLCMDSKDPNFNFCTITNEGMFTGRIYEETLAFPEENRVTFDFGAAIPIRITQGHEEGDYQEGYLDSRINFDLTFVENKDAGADELPYLIDSVNNTFKESSQRYLADNPALAFEPQKR